MDQMRRCVVSLLDLVGMKNLLARAGKKPHAMSAMEALDRMCNGHATYVQHIDHIYCWNDSALFLSYLDTPAPRDMNALVQEVSHLKEAIDSECQMGSFVVMVKGKSFVPNNINIRAQVHQGAEPDPVYHYVKASSMAFANCETIVRLYRNDHHPWYIDQRIRNALGAPLQALLTEGLEFEAFPDMDKRTVYTADGYLHQRHH